MLNQPCMLLACIVGKIDGKCNSAYKISMNKNNATIRKNLIVGARDSINV